MAGFDAGSVVAHVKADISDFQKGMDNAKQEVKGFGGTLKNIGSNIADFGKQSAIFTGIAVAGAVAFGKASVDAYNESERTLAQLDAVLKSTGNSIGITKSELVQYSRELQNNTTISDESALATENMLLTFTSLGKKEFPSATKAIIDTAYAMNHGLTPSTEQLVDMTKQMGKALQDPDAGLGALHRVGVNTAELEKKFKSITSVEEKQKLIIQELNTEFGGSGAAAVATYSGSIEQLNNKFNDFQENLGQVIASLLMFGATGNDQRIYDSLANLLGNDKLADQITDGLVKIREAFLQFATWISANQETVTTFLTGLAVGLSAILVIGTITALLTALLNPITLVVAAITALYFAWSTNFMGIRDITMNVINDVVNFFNNYLKPILDIGVAWWKDHWDSITLAVRGGWTMVVGIFQLFWALLSGIIKIALDLMTGNWKRAWEDIKAMVSGGWEAVKNIFGGAIEFIRGWGGIVLSELVKPFEDAWNKIRDLMNKIKDAMDPNKRHSPSLVDRVKAGVDDLNKAWQTLDFPVMPTANITAGATVGGSGSGNNMISVNISLDGAIISDNAGAEKMGEIMGDNIIKKLQENLRF